jgi:hypothetical protein
MKIPYPSQADLHEMFNYEDGQLINKYRRAPSAPKGAIAGRLVKSVGYYSVTIKARRYQLNRLIWIYHNGEIPKDLLVDHISRDTHDNRIENLRLATYTQNEWNKPKLGCSFENGKWRARVKRFGKNIHLGMFESKEKAMAAYDAYAAQLHGEFQCQQ